MSIKFRGNIYILPLLRRELKIPLPENSNLFVRWQSEKFIPLF